MKRSTIETIIKAFNVASDDETRVYLCGVFCHVVNDNLFIVATDGYSLVQFKVDDSNFKSILGEKSIIIHRDNEKLLKHLLKTNKRQEFDANLDNERILKVDNLGLELVIREYPNYANIFSKEKFSENANKISICFNAEYLMQIAKTIVNNKCKKVKLTFDSKNIGNSPMVVEGDHQDLELAILMPIKG